MSYGSVTTGMGLELGRVDGKKIKSNRGQQEASKMFNVPNNKFYDSNDKFSIKKSLNRSYINYKETFWTDNAANMAIWVPAQMVTFGLLPPHLRLPWMSCVGFIWYV